MICDLCADDMLRPGFAGIIKYRMRALCDDCWRDLKEAARGKA